MDQEHKGARYWDRTRPTEERVRDLLARMDVREKAAQLGSVWVYEVLEGDELSAEKSRALLAAGIGQITRMGGASHLGPGQVAEVTRSVQRFLRNETRLGVPAMVHEEALAGYMGNGGTAFPQAIGLASSFDPDLAREMADAIRRELRASGGHQALAPLLDVCRDPRWGRTEETFGEDPYLVAQMGIAYVEGLQAAGEGGMAMATGKHFVAYGESEGGLNWAPTHVGARELAEVFMLPFEAAVKVARLASIMPAYHELDGVACHANRHLLEDVLRHEWGFDGLVVSDYFAIACLHTYHHLFAGPAEAAAQALSAGVDVELPTGDYYREPLLKALETGLVSEDALDAAVSRVLTWKFKLGLFDEAIDGPVRGVGFDPEAHRDLARRVARESIVLLKNDGILPLSKSAARIAVLGPNADAPRHMMGDYSYPSHVESLLEQAGDNVFNTPLPGQHGRAELPPVVSVFAAMKSRLGAAGVTHAAGCDVLDPDPGGIPAAVEKARGADVAVMVVGDKSGLTLGCSTGESRDRMDLGLPGAQTELVRAVLATGTPVALVLVNGRPVSLPDDVVAGARAIVEAWLPGQEGGEAVADVLLGDYNPSGRLPISVPRSVGQVPAYHYHKPSGGRSHWHGDYVEGSTRPLFPFGFGLSYTEFRFENLTVPKTARAGEPIEAAVDVTNTGKVAGDAVVELFYGRRHLSVTRPATALIGVARVALRPGETRRVTFRIAGEELAAYDAAMRLVVEPGPVTLKVGHSAEDTVLEETLSLTGPSVAVTRSTFTTAVRVG